MHSILFTTAGDEYNQSMAFVQHENRIEAYSYV